ncbi:hypothetical protein J6590_028343 [Homalodisca vitripennis]|nr:hypothetical protein J6590_028343 [Homalodisca vitripennis]
MSHGSSSLTVCIHISRITKAYIGGCTWSKVAIRFAHTPERDTEFATPGNFRPGGYDVTPRGCNDRAKDCNNTPPPHQ